MRRASIFVPLIVAFALSSAIADTLILKDGTTVEGRVLKGPTKVAVLTEGGQTRAYPVADVVKVIRGAATDNDIYKALKDHAGNHPDRLEKLHDWCIARNMKAEAMAALKGAYRQKKAQARNARDYRLLVAWCDRHGLDAEKTEAEKLLAAADANPPDTRPDPKPDPGVKAGAATYMVIPIKGEIGKHMTPELFDQCMAEVEKQRPDYVVLYVDSPGGSTDTAEKIVERLAKVRDVKTVAYIKSAISAAAIISMTCKQIVVENTATIGGATAYAMSPWGMPMDINEKMQSVWRATCRSAAELGGHQRLIAEAMVDNGLELYLDTDADGKPIVKEGAAPGKRVLTRKGRLLTMTARESMECGLAVGVVPGLRDLGKALKEADLSAMSDTSEKIAITYAEKIDKAAKELEDIVERFKDAMVKVEGARSRRDARAFVMRAIRILEEAKRFAKENPYMNLDEKAIERDIDRLQAQRRKIR